MSSTRQSDGRALHAFRPVSDGGEAHAEAIGTQERRADEIRNAREKTSMSYVGVFPTHTGAIAPVIDSIAPRWVTDAYL